MLPKSRAEASHLCLDLLTHHAIVSHMPNQVTHFSRDFQALAEPTRRAVVERLSGGPVPTRKNARPFKMAFPSFLQHLDVFKKCGLVTIRKSGRVRTYELAPKP